MVVEHCFEFHSLKRISLYECETEKTIVLKHNCIYKLFIHWFQHNIPRNFTHLMFAWLTWFQDIN